MRFEKAYGVWRERRLTQVGAQLLRTCERAFRSHVDRDEDDGMLWVVELMEGNAVSLCFGCRSIG